MEGIFFSRNLEGMFDKTDNWPAGKKRAQIRVGDRPPFGSYSLSAALEIIEGAIAKGFVKQDLYSIVPTVTEPMPEEIKELLKATTKEKKVDRPLITCSYENCQNQYPRTKGRYPQKFCTTHRSK